MVGDPGSRRDVPGEPSVDARNTVVPYGQRPVDQRARATQMKPYGAHGARLPVHDYPMADALNLPLTGDGGHAFLAVALAGGGREVVQAVELIIAEHDAVGGSVLLDAGDAPGARDRRDVIALSEQPGQRDLRRGCAGLGGDGLDFGNNAEVVLEVLADEAGIVFAPVVVGDVIDGADLSGEEAVTER
jgi:hypothetical protein